MLAITAFQTSMQTAFIWFNNKLLFEVVVVDLDVNILGN